MSTSQTQSRPPVQRGRRGNTRGRGGRRGTASLQTKIVQSDMASQDPVPSIQQDPAQKRAQSTDLEKLETDEAAICFICAEPVKYYSISDCNHRTCHVCALRLRALYKKNDCTFCKVSEKAKHTTRKYLVVIPSLT
jgi:E3 ubiquitin-protein ligase ZNF598